jgi:HEAT repeat protein
MNPNGRVRANVKVLVLMSGPLFLGGCPPPLPPEELEVRPPVEKVMPLDPALREAARKELADEATARDPILRVHAIEAERECMGADAKDDYLRALSDGAPVVRYAGAMAVGELQLEVARGTLHGMVEDKNPFVRIGARFALHRLGDYTYSHDFEHFARDPDPHIRGMTAMALGRMGETSAINILMVLRKDPNSAVRQQASEALWRLGDMEGAEDLAGLVKSHYRDDQKVAILGLASTHDPSVRQEIRPELSGDVAVDPSGMPVANDPDVKLVAARAMAMLGGGPYDIGFPIAMEGAREADPKLRVLAALALGAIGRTDEQPVLRDMLKDQDPEVRIAAATAILQLTPPEKRPTE